MDSVFCERHMLPNSRPSPFPDRGRVYRTDRLVRLGDVTPKGRLRLDAVARYLQDIATDDALDGNYDDPHGWVVRRTEMWVTDFPKYLDHISLATWCGGVGSHWAERRTRIAFGDPENPRIALEAAALWVRVDLETLRPRPLSDAFRQLVGETAGGRTVSARLHLGRTLGETDHAEQHMEMPLRFTDFDAVGHLNNAVYWEPLEEYLGRHRELRAPLYASLEHHQSVETATSVHVDVFTREQGVILRMAHEAQIVALGALARHSATT